MRFRNYLTELFKEKKDFEIMVKTDELFKVKFEVNSIPYHYGAEFREDDGYGEVGFEDKTQSFETDMDITGTAKENALEVYAYVVSITKYFLREYQPIMVGIEGFDPRQSKLYKKLAKRFSSEIEKMGYKVKIRESRIIIRKG